MKFIVIEGLDGSGKSTQIGLLKEYLDKQGLLHKSLHFPRIESSPIFGDLIARFLRGELGSIDSVDPYLVALLYAGERNNSKEVINKWLSEKYLVIVDRYVYSNIAFQCAKVEKSEDKQILSDWIKNVEFDYFKIPVPNLSLFLDVPFEFTKNKLTKERIGEDRQYLKGKQDIHEKSLNFQQRVREVYLSLLDSENSFKKIDCFSSEEIILPPHDISKKIIQTLIDNNILMKC